MQIADFDFQLPAELIARRPVRPRDASRLLVLNRGSGSIEHRRFHELPDLLDPRDILVRNNTRVIPARLIGQRQATGGKWEGLVEAELPSGHWQVMASTRGKIKPGETVIVGQGLVLTLVEQQSDGTWLVQPHRSPSDATSLPELLARYGEIPLPPYIRDGRADEDDQLDYQTVYSTNPGAIAAPTAGLHFTPELFDQLAARGISWTDLTLHVGAGTFQPIRTPDIRDHVMHAEYLTITPETVERLRSQRARGGRIVAIGTTSVRALETASLQGTLQPFDGQTSLFIQPGHPFRSVDALITNFHLPKSSLLVLVAAFAGLSLIQEAYHQAIQERYRFYSYGDAMLIL